MKETESKSNLNSYQNTSYYYELDFSETELDDIPFYVNLVSKHSSDILELTCGTGRVTIPLARNNIHVTALDISVGMLSILQNKISRENDSVSNKITIVESNMTNFRLNKRFNCILIPFHSFQALTSDSEISEALNTIAEHLTPDGVFILNLYSPLENMKTLEGERELKVVFRNGNITYEKETVNSFVDTKKQVIDYIVNYYPLENGQKVGCFTDVFKTKYYYRDQIAELLEQHDFKIIETFNGFGNNTNSEINLTEYTIVCALK